MPNRWETTDVLCDVCRHNFFTKHYEVGRTQPYDDEERRRKCRDCRQCQEDDNNTFDSIVQGIKNPNHTAPEREPMPV